MCQRLISLFSFVLVLGLVLTTMAQGVDPDLVAWWKCNEGSGTTVADEMGNYNGTMTGAGVTWGTGIFGACLEFDGITGGVDCGDIDLTGSFSVSLWVKTAALGTVRSAIAKGYIGDGWEIVLEGVNDPLGSIGFAAREDGGATNAIYRTGFVEVDTWYHIAGVVDTDAKKQLLYVDGNLEASADLAGSAGVQQNDSPLTIGHASRGVKWRGSIDEVHCYKRALTEAEILQVMAGEEQVGEFAQASDPNPADGTTDEPRDGVVLNWTPGEAADKHDVYFGTSLGDVNDASPTEDPAGVYVGRQDQNSLVLDRLELGQTYYWRVDEVNAPPDYTIFKGDIWSFTVPIAYPLPSERITGTASSSNSADEGPENTVNGSGLDADDLHSTETADMWLSSATAEPPTWIQYEFDKAYKLHQMLVWNHNSTFESLVGLGVKDVTIEYSLDGADWMSLGGTSEIAREIARASGSADYGYNTTVDFEGVAAKYVKITANSNWGGVFNQYGLSEVRFSYIPVFAREPSPDSGATDVSIGTIDEPIDVLLGFRAGREAVEHNVYFSTDEQAVIDGTAAVATMTETSYDPLSLNLGTTYYWRVDEVNEAETPTTWQGDIWNFSTHEFFVVDDFEDYDDYEPNEIFSTWIDGYYDTANGALAAHDVAPWAETTIVHGGGQAIPFFYSNTGAATYSEATRTFAVPQDWTEAGVQTLVLYFYGTAGNTGQLYVRVNGSKVVYDGDAADIEQVQWNQWNIDLASLGVNLQNVTNMIIGIDGSGASGTLYFDDIRLYPLGDINPVAYWKLDEGSGTTVADEMGNYNGLITGDVTWGTGIFGACLEFDGETGEVDCGDIDLTGSVSISVWLRPALPGAAGAHRRAVAKGQYNTGWQIGQSGRDENAGAAEFAAQDAAGPMNAIYGTTVMEADTWYHIVGVFDVDAEKQLLYVDGNLEASADISADSPGIMQNDSVFMIGRTEPEGGSWRWAGSVDEVRYYNR